ncbi:MAG: hypothetical protein AAF565_03295 [Pseudomonadota bacterium]
MIGLMWPRTAQFRRPKGGTRAGSGTSYLKVALAALVLLVPSATLADPVETILARAKADCAGFENGRFEANDAVTKIDLDGDDAPDILLDESRFTCTSAASMYCGSGGCQLHAIVGDTATSFQAEGWRVIDWNDRPVLLVMRDGYWCGGIGAQSCVEAVVWSQGQRLTVMPPQQ